MMKGYLKNDNLKIKWFLSSKEVGCWNKFFLTVESLLFIGARARAGKKKNQRRSKTDWLRNLPQHWLAAQLSAVLRSTLFDVKNKTTQF